MKFSGLVSDGIQLFLDRINLLLQTEMFLLLSTEQGELGDMDTYIVQLDHFVGEKYGISHGFGLSVDTKGDFNRCGQLFRGIGGKYACWQSI